MRLCKTCRRSDHNKKTAGSVMSRQFFVFIDKAESVYFVTVIFICLVTTVPVASLILTRIS